MSAWTATTDNFGLALMTPRGTTTEGAMRELDGEQMMVRVFLGEDDRWQGQFLHVALVERLRKEGIAGATVFRGVCGYGARSIVHSTHLLNLSEDLPLVVEVVDTPEHIDRMLPIIDAMVTEGLVTVEKVRVIKYSAGPAQGNRR